jgi:hypothetical protein
MLRIEQTLTCDLCGEKMSSLRQVVYPGSQMQKIERGPFATTQWHDVCVGCHGSVVEALSAVRAKAAQ